MVFFYPREEAFRQPAVWISQLGPLLASLAHLIWFIVYSALPINLAIAAALVESRSLHFQRWLNPPDPEGGVQPARRTRVIPLPDPRLVALVWILFGVHTALFDVLEVYHWGVFLLAVGALFYGDVHKQIVIAHPMRFWQVPALVGMLYCFVLGFLGSRYGYSIIVWGSGVYRMVALCACLYMCYLLLCEYADSGTRGVPGVDADENRRVYTACTTTAARFWVGASFGLFWLVQSILLHIYTRDTTRTYACNASHDMNSPECHFRAISDAILGSQDSLWSIPLAVLFNLCPYAGVVFLCIIVLLWEMCSLLLERAVSRETPTGFTRALARALGRLALRPAQLVRKGIWAFIGCTLLAQPVAHIVWIDVGQYMNRMVAEHGIGATFVLGFLAVILLRP